LRTIAVLNQKGGVGKTTTTVNTAAALAALGKRVAVIDLDPQAHLTIHLGVEPQSLTTGSYEVLTQSADFAQSLMMVRPNLWLLGANINLVGAETELVSVVGREIILREAMLACAEQFDFCLIDCAPSLGLLSLNALAAAQEVLIPLQPHFLALQGFGKLLQTVDLVNKRINQDLKVTGVVLCMFDTRASLPNEVRADIEQFLENARGTGSAWSEAQVLPTFIRRNIKLAEAPSYGQTIVEYDPACNGAIDYRNVARFFLGLEPEQEGRDEAEPEIEDEVELEVEPESSAQPQMTAEQEPAPETELSEHHAEAETVMDSPAAPFSEPHTAPARQYDTGTAGEPETKDDAPFQEMDGQPEPEAPIVIEPAAPAPEPVHYEPRPVEGYQPATSPETVPQAPSVQDQTDSTPTVEPASVESADATESVPEEMQQVPESPTEQTPPEQPPFQIQAIHLPAPRTYSPRPLQDKTAPSADQAQTSEGVQDEHQTSQDEREQVGY